MSEFKGTNKPLKIKSNRTDIYSVHDEFGIMAEFYSGNGISDDQAKANAVIFTCAPEMLEMLQIWLMDMEERGHAYGECYTMTKQLIKKATTI